MILPNPDLIYPEGDGYSFASGAVAGMFESALDQRYRDRTDLKFARLGKPHPAIFEEAISRCGTLNVVMVGDNPGTDIRGANQMGITSVLVYTGLATADLTVLPDSDRPDYRLTTLAP